MNIQVSKASQAAIERVEKLGGTISCVYHSPESIKCMRQPEKYIIKPQGIEIPSSKRELERYIDPRQRGYLAGKVEGVDRKDIIRKVVELLA